jgi:hypothetical protein
MNHPQSNQKQHFVDQYYNLMIHNHLAEEHYQPLRLHLSLSKRKVEIETNIEKVYEDVGG